MTIKHRVLAIAAAALALSFSAAQAAPSAPMGASAASAGGHHQWQRKRFEMRMKRLHDELKLNPEQEQRWQAALTTMRQSGKTMRENRKQSMQQTRQLRDAQILDLSALRAAREHVADQNRALRARSNDAWIGFYNDLNDTQKAIVSTVIKERWHRMMKMRMMRMRMMHHHMGRMDQPMQHGMPASAPAAQ